MMGKISFFLGLQISQSPRGIFLNQSKYALESLKKYGMESSDPADTPMVDKSKLDEDPQGKAVDPTHYCGMVGTLMYLTASRPDLTFFVCMCARQHILNRCPNDTNIMAAGSKDSSTNAWTREDIPQWSSRFSYDNLTREPNGGTEKRSILSGSPYVAIYLIVSSCVRKDGWWSEAGGGGCRFCLRWREYEGEKMTRWGVFGIRRSLKDVGVMDVERGEVSVVDVYTGFGRQGSGGALGECGLLRATKLMLVKQRMRWIAIERLQQQYQNEVNDIRAERIAKSANPLALLAAAQPYSDNYYQAPKPQRTNTTSSSTRPSASTRHKGKEIAKPVTPQSESVSEEDSDPEQAQRDKDMQKNLALLAKYFKKLYKPTNNNLRTSSNSRNKTEDTTPRYNNDNQSGQFGNQRTMTVAGARETVGSQVVQQNGIQCFNCKGFGHYAKECRKPKREVLPEESSSTEQPLEQVQNHDENNVFANERRHSEQPESINDTYVLEKAIAMSLQIHQIYCNK
ncbi:copia protein [Tanacetum coccineum]